MVKYTCFGICLISLLLTSCGSPSTGQLTQNCNTTCVANNCLPAYENCDENQLTSTEILVNCQADYTTCSTQCGCTVTVEG